MLELIRSVKNFQSTPIQKVWDNDEDQILAYMRKDLVFVFNFNRQNRLPNYGFLVPKGEYEVVLNTDANRFGASGSRMIPFIISRNSIHCIKKRKKNGSNYTFRHAAAVVLKKVKKAEIIWCL